MRADGPAAGGASGSNSRTGPHPVIIGAYAASPAHGIWNPDLEAELFGLLDHEPAVRGLELPWTGGLHPHDDEWLLRALPRRFDLVLTSIPGTMQRLQTDPGFGLASRSDDGRRAAVTEVLRMRDGVHRLNDAMGRRAVIGVEVHSAPRADRASARALSASLAELDVEGSEWDGATVVIEHCDALVPGQPAEKGFLPLAAELDAVEPFPSSGVCINWGRSAIEVRSAHGVAAQITQAAASGRLRGLMFSGAAALPSGFGAAWADAHLPMTPEPDFPFGEPASLLTPQHLAEALAAAGTLEWIGLKYGWADASAPLAPRAAMLTSAARLLSS